MFQPIATRKILSQHIEEELIKAIREGVYPPGHKIPTENELCQIFNVSRTVIREAIKKLNAMGLVDIKKGSGIYVSQISTQNAKEFLNMFFELSSDKNLILNTIDCRRMIEPIIAAQAAILRTDEHIERLKKNMDHMRQCSIKNRKKEAELDNEFHNILLDIVENPVLQLLINPIFSLIPKFKTDVFAKNIHGDLKSEKETTLYYHNGILEGIKAQDSYKTKKFMEEHLMKTRINYLQSINTL
ncbi:FadR/GntR family transcriptional regulator [Maribacter sp. 2304DJ31-5]|uniref:FadR/GntR family transcriptional regulator n=1 Tax=Maribacter sp. 2304DJ31-5 TaxID=3386273 RepID=UPI0039BD1CA5